MKTSTLIRFSLPLAGLAILIADIAGAHHSFAMFDRTREEVFTGTVARWAFNSPHAALYITNDSDGEVWAFEGSAPPNLIERDMTGYTFQPGEHVTVIGCPLRDGRHGGALGYIIKDGDEADFDSWYRPNDGGCGPSQDWGEWYNAGYRSKAEAESALGIDPDD